MQQILVVQAGAGLAGIVGRMFSRTHAVVAVADGSTALAKIAEGASFEAIVCDAPDGTALHAELLKVDKDQAGRVLFLTSLGTISDGSLRHLFERPSTVDALCEAIANILQHS